MNEKYHPVGRKIVRVNLACVSDFKKQKRHPDLGPPEMSMPPNIIIAFNVSPHDIGPINFDMCRTFHRLFKLDLNYQVYVLMSAKPISVIKNIFTIPVHGIVLKY